MKKHLFTGTGVALVTPFNKYGEVNFESLSNLVNHVNDKLDYLVVMGTTAESVVLSKKEKDAVVDHIKEVNQDKIPIVLGMGSNNTHLLTEQIKSQNFEGISGLLSVSPYYNKPTQNGIYEHYKAVAEASPVPIIIYNVPGRTGSCISPATTIRLAQDFEQIVATKEASGNLEAIMEIIKNKPADFAVISGDDALSMPLMSIGAQGVISVIANGLPAQMSSLINACLKNDFESARNYHYKLIEIIGSIFEEGNPAGIKSVLKYLKVSEQYVRLPLVPPSSDLNNKLQSLIDTLLNS